MSTLVDTRPPTSSDTDTPPDAVPAHGGTLVSRWATGQEATELAAEVESLPALQLDERERYDAALIASGALSPLEGFASHADYVSTITEMRLASGTFFPVPITLSAPREDVRALKTGQRVRLEASGEAFGVLEVSDIYDSEFEREAIEVYKTVDEAHPGVAYLKQRGDRALVGGQVRVFRSPIPQSHGNYDLGPARTRAAIRERGWRRVVAFQTRNPIHRAHEYLLKCALETVDGLAIHPLVGPTKADDIAADVRLACYEALIGRYFPADRVLLSVFPLAMRYAGPREALLHALARQNYGFSHFIVGRDHAGVGNYYGTYDAQRIFDTIPKGALAITPMFFEHTFYCKACGVVASAKTCPHEASERLILSGTRVRETLSRGEALPPEFSRPEVASVLFRAYRAA